MKLLLFVVRHFVVVLERYMYMNISTPLVIHVSFWTYDRLVQPWEFFCVCSV